MRTTALIVACFALVSVAASLHLPTSFAEISMQQETLHVLESARAEIDAKDFLAVPLDPVNNAEDKKILDDFLATPGLREFRERRAQLTFHMSLDEYDAMHAKHRNALMTAADNLGIKYGLHTESFTSLLSKVEEAMEHADSGVAALVDRTEVATLRTVSYLFETRTSLQTAVVEDAVLFNLKEKISKAIDWLINYVKTNKCKWCQSIVSYIRDKACAAAGKFLCGLAASAAGSFSPIINKYICGSPVNVAGILAGWCTSGVQWLQKKIGLTDDCICSFSVPSFNIPKFKIPLIGEIPGRSVSIGQVCSTGGKKCLWDKLKDNKKPAPKPKPSTNKKPTPKPKPSTNKKPTPKPKPSTNKKPTPKPKPSVKQTVDAAKKKAKELAEAAKKNGKKLADAAKKKAAELAKKAAAAAKKKAAELAKKAAKAAAEKAKELAKKKAKELADKAKKKAAELAKAAAKKLAQAAKCKLPIYKNKPECKKKK